MKKAKNMENKTGITKGVFQVGVLVNDVDECKRLFCDALGMKIVFDHRNVIQPAKELAGCENQIMNVMMLRGDNDVDLELHQYVSPKAKQMPPMNHNEIGSMHFMLKVDDIEKVAEKIQSLGYSLMSPIVESTSIHGFKFTYFRGPDGMMVELHEGECIRIKEEAAK